MGWKCSASGLLLIYLGSSLSKCVNNLVSEQFNGSHQPEGERLMYLIIFVAERPDGSCLLEEARWYP
jgi:hypothetical protein